MKVFLGVVLFLLAAWGILYLIATLGYAVPFYHGPASDHFDGTHFHNLPGGKSRSGKPQGLGRYLGMRLKQRFSPDETEKRSTWPDWVEIKPGVKPAARVLGLRITFVNHATLLIQIEGLNLLTDAQWSNRASPVSWLGPKRHHAPGIAFDDLPPIDAVLLSHNHYDHMDLPTLRRLVAAHHPKVIAPLANQPFLSSRHIDSFDLDWWQSQALNATVSVTAVPAQHFSARSVNDRNRALWGGFVIKGQSQSVYFAGDTGYAPHFKEIGRRFPDLTVALIPIGAYRPQWFMSPMHVSPEEAVQAQVDLRARAMIPMHYGTFKLSEEGINDPVTDLEAELKRRGPSAPKVFILRPGEHRDF